MNKKPQLDPIVLTVTDHITRLILSLVNVEMAICQAATGDLKSLHKYISPDHLSHIVQWTEMVICKNGTNVLVPVKILLASTLLLI